MTPGHATGTVRNLGVEGQTAAGYDTVTSKRNDSLSTMPPGKRAPS